MNGEPDMDNYYYEDEDDFDYAHLDFDSDDRELNIIDDEID